MTARVKPKATKPKQETHESWRLRLLPTLLIACGLMLFLRLGYLANHLLEEDASGPLSAHAEAPAKPQEKSAEVDKGATDAAKEATSGAAKEADSGKENSPSPAGENPSNPQKSDVASNQIITPEPVQPQQTQPVKEEKKVEVSKEILENMDPVKFTEEQAKVLNELLRKHQELTKLEKDIKIREKSLQIKEGRVQEELQNMKEIEGLIQKTIKAQKDGNDKELIQLAKIYEGMKEKKAAEVFSKLPITTISSVIRKMGQRKVSAIFNQMDPEKVAKITSTTLNDNEFYPPPGVNVDEKQANP